MRDSTLSVELPLALSAQQCDEYEHVGAAVLAQTLNKYTCFIQHAPVQRAFDARRWKLLKRREQLRVYGARDRRFASPFDEPSPKRASASAVYDAADWVPQTKLCCVGSILCSMDDAMFGTVSPTEFAMARRSLLVKDDFVQRRTVKDIKLPTDDDPFAYVGLKWSARASKVGGIVKARDMVYLMATGFTHIVHEGRHERIGYVIYHSVDVPELAPKDTLGFLRSRLSLCILYREQAPGVIDVYATIAGASGSGLPRKLIALFSTGVLLTIAQVPECAMKLKLAWMLKVRAKVVDAQGARPPAFSKQMQWFFRTMMPSCPQCARELTGMRTLTMCAICETSVCHRCVTTRKLALGATIDELVYQGMSICKVCITTALRMDHTLKLAIYDYVRPYDALRGDDDVLSDDGASTSGLSVEISQAELDQALDGIDAAAEETDAADVAATTPQQEETAFLPEAPSASSPEPGMASPYEHRLWLQINELRLQAEETYRMAKQQTLAIQHADPVHQVD